MLYVRQILRNEIELINDWLVKRDMPSLPVEDFPAIGFLALDGVTPIAAAFIRRLEGGFAQYDGLITNPGATSELRDKANDLVTTEIIKTCKQLGIKALTAYSTDENTLIRAEKHGFRRLPHTMIALGLIQNDTTEPL